MLALWKERRHGERLLVAKEKEGEGLYENLQEKNVADTIVQDALILSWDNINDAWVVDLGASFHATPHRKYFQDYV